MAAEEMVCAGGGSWCGESKVYLTSPWSVPTCIGMSKDEDLKFHLFTT